MSDTTDTSEPTRAVGRPTKYKPEYCDAVISWGFQGKSKVWMCSELNINTDTMYEWEKNFPEFSEALRRAMVHSQRWWEQAGQDGMYQGTGFNANVWAKNVSNRFRADWTDKTETKTELAGEVAITKIERVIVKP